MPKNAAAMVEAVVLCAGWACRLKPYDGELSSRTRDRNCSGVIIATSP
jgi:hypothetical protein